MKPINKMAVAALLALSSAGLASATTTVVHVTGSTAYRVADVSAETAYLNGLGAGGVKAEYFGSSLTGANDSVVYGPVVSSNQTIFENHFNGSVGGTEALVTPVTQAYALASAYSGTATAVTTIGASGVVAVGGTSGATPIASTETVNSDIAFSDVSFSAANQIISASTLPQTLGTPNDNLVGIVPFVFVAGKGSPATFNNMTPQEATFLWTNGTAPLALFTGLSTDETTDVFALGRDVDSGTRGTLLAETGFGLNGSGVISTPVAQYFPYDTTAHANSNSATVGVVGIDGTATSIGAFAPVPAETLDGYFMDVGDGGYFSGGNLATAMKATNTSGGLIVTALGVSDATSAIGGSAVLMSYNGVKFDPTSSTAANKSLIYEGSYTFWSYEHEFFYGTGTVATIANGLKSSLVSGGIDTVSSDGVTMASMKVARSGDGQNVQPNYSF